MDLAPAIGQLGSTTAIAPMGRPVAESPVAPDGRSGAAAPIIYLEIHRDQAIDRMVFEYRRGVDGDVVQRWPARQVVEFYQRIEALVARDGAIESTPSARGVPDAADRSDDAVGKKASMKGDGAPVASDTDAPTLQALA